MYPLAHMPLLLVILATVQQLPRNHYMIPLTLARLLHHLLQRQKLLMWPTMTGAPPSHLPATKQHLPRPHLAASQPHSPTSTPTKPAKQQKRGDTWVTRAQGSPGAEGPTMPPDKLLHKGKPPPASRFLELKIPSSMCTGVLRRIKRVLPTQAFGNLLHINSVCDFCCSVSPSTCVVHIWFIFKCSRYCNGTVKDIGQSMRTYAVCYTLNSLQFLYSRKLC